MAPLWIPALAGKMFAFGFTAPFWVVGVAHVEKEQS